MGQSSPDLKLSLLLFKTPSALAPIKGEYLLASRFYRGNIELRPEIIGMQANVEVASPRLLLLRHSEFDILRFVIRFFPIPHSLFPIPHLQQSFLPDKPGGVAGVI